MSSKLLDVPGANKNKRCLKNAKDKQAKYYNRRTQVKPQIPVKQTVRAKINDKTGWVKAEVIEQLPYRSYRIETENGIVFCRNRKHLRISNEAPIIRNDVHVVPQPASTRSVEMQRASSSNSSSSDAVMPQQPPQPAAAAAPRNATPQSAAILQPRSCLKPPDIVTRSGRQIKPPVRFNDYVAK